MRPSHPMLLTTLVLVAVALGACTTTGGPDDAAPREPTPTPSAPPTPTPAAPAASPDVGEVRLTAIDQLESAVFAHPDPGWRAGEQRLRDELDALRSVADTLDDDAFTLEVVRIVALLDGHSAARPLDPWPLADLPLYRFGDDVHVVAADDPALLGARVLMIGDTPTADAWAAVTPYVSYDSESNRALAGTAMLRTPAVLAATGVIADATTLTYELELRDGTTTTVTPQLAVPDEPQVIAALTTTGLPAVPGVRWLEHRDARFWSEHRDDLGVVVLQFNRVASSATSPLTGESVTASEEADRVRSLLAAAPGARLVIDLRHNPGGNNTTLGPFRELALEVGADDPCALAVLIGRQTFSAAANYATQVEQGSQARFYGEPTGGSPNLYGDTRRTALDDVGIAVHVSSRYWEFSDPDDDRPSIEPDVAVPLTVDDFLAGRDPVMDAVVSDPACT